MYILRRSRSTSAFASDVTVIRPWSLSEDCASGARDQAGLDARSAGEILLLLDRRQNVNSNRIFVRRVSTFRIGFSRAQCCLMAWPKKFRQRVQIVPPCDVASLILFRMPARPAPSERMEMHEREMEGTKRDPGKRKSSSRTYKDNVTLVRNPAEEGRWRRNVDVWGLLEIGNLVDCGWLDPFALSQACRGGLRVRLV